MKFFLRLKHWQLFALLIGFPIVADSLAVGSAFSTADISEGTERLLKIFPMLMLVYIGLFFGWLWSIGTFLTKKLSTSSQNPDDLRTVNLPHGLFKGALIIPTLYIAFLCWFVGKLMWGNEMSELFIMEHIGLIVTAHLMSTACLFFVLYYNAKALRSVELQRRARFGDYIIDFILFWFFPIGIWILQPRINKVLAAENAENTEGGNFV